MKPTRTNYSTPSADVLAVSLELAAGTWKIALQDGKRENPAIKIVDADTPGHRVQQAIDEIGRIKEKWGLASDVRTVVLYEAGQDGFWIARILSALGIETLICDPASVLVSRHSRRAKTDRLDAIRLVNTLRAWLGGERDCMRVIRVPSVDAEAQRHHVRDRGELQKEVKQHRDRMRKLFRTVGCWDSADGDIAGRLARGTICGYGGTPLPPQLLARLQRECERLALVEQQFAALEKELIKELPIPVQERVAKLQRLKAVGKSGRFVSYSNYSGADSRTDDRWAPASAWYRSLLTAGTVIPIRASASRATGGCVHSSSKWRGYGFDISPAAPSADGMRSG